MWFTATIANAYVAGHAHILRVVDELSDQQFAWQPPGTATSIAFNVWHLARWADHLQATIPGMTVALQRRLAPGRQLWERDQLADQWSLDRTQLGYAETGMLMPPDAARRLTLPPKALVVTYARAAFAAAEVAVGAIDDQQWRQPERAQDPAQERTVLGPPRTVGDAVLSHLTHDHRHLGMIEYARGLLGLGGTATS